MIRKTPKTPTNADQDRRAKRILEEYRRHKAEVEVSLGDDEFVDDEGLHEALIYTGWSAQKIAGLQLWVENLAARVDQLERDVAEHRAVTC